MDLLPSYGSDDDDDDNNDDSEHPNNAGGPGSHAAAGAGEHTSTGEPQQEQASKTTGSGSTKQQQEEAFARRRPAQRADRRYLQSAPAISLTAGRNSSQGGGNVTNALTVYGANQQQQQSSPNGGASGAPRGELMLMNNPTKAVMYQPVQGPAEMDPSIKQNSKQQAAATEQNVAFDEATFSEQRVAFQRSGRALAPDQGGTEIVRTTLGYDTKRLKLFVAQEEERKRNKRPRPTTDDDEKEALVQGSDDEVEFGVWGPPSAEERWVANQAMSDVAKGGVESLAPEQLAERAYIQERNRQRGIEQDERNNALEESSTFDRMVERKMAHLLPPKQSFDQQPCEPSTTFHGTEQVDYKGRSWMAPPAGSGMGGGQEATITTQAEARVDTDHHKCFYPKKCVHRFTGHNKGVHRIRLFPRTGHLLLSAGLDGKCKVWSVPNKQVMRTYVGHTAAVRDAQFNWSGTKFVSASFDRYLRLWDTESGQVLQTFGNKKVPYCVQFYPHDDNYFVVGCSDSKIVTYDCTTAEITQEYNHHLAPVNAIVFVTPQDNSAEGTTKMVTSSDDKKVLVWEWDIGVPIKYISDPTMHSMPCLSMHPSGTAFCGQSLDNTICVFQAGGRFTLSKKSKFSGHIVSGYACEICFSPDGQYVVSGDGNGSVFVWDWKRHRILQKYRAHAGGPAISCAWHPLEPSTLFTCGWDGLIKMWQ